MFLFDIIKWSHTFESSSIHGDHLNRIVWRLFTIETGDGRFDDSRFRLDFKYGHTSVLVNDILLNGIRQFGV